MNMLKKGIALCIVIVLVMAAIPAVLAVDVQPGNTVTVYLNLGTGYGLDGSITVSDPNGIISGVTFVGPSGFDGFVEPVGSGYYAYYSKNNVSSAGSCTIIARVTLKNDASLAGKRATITFSGTTSQPNEGNFNDVPAYAEATVTMIGSAPAVKIDYSELQKQIDIAEGLNKGDYTAESWKTLEAALVRGKNHLTSQDQAAVDNAAKDLADAIAALVKMDYSKLEEAIQSGNELINGDELGKLWKELMDAIANGNGLLSSGDQEAVDAATAEILKLMGAFGAEEETYTCEHSSIFCNIKIHKLWPILFFISLFVNVVLVVLVIKKKEDK